MDNVLSVIALAVFCVVIICLAAGVTWTVVKLLPLKDKAKTTATKPTQS
jgi:hypothetical protein